ncbi:MAG: hypothetical protein KDC98_19810, partial [Planctomycetes bacterium]|nr:hypothetical protein [Planctomycetota bacterium]
ALVIGLVLGCFWNHRVVWQGLVQTSAILGFIAGVIEASRRHSTRQAKAVFALYADGVLAAEDAAAIDDARQKDAKFDAEVRAWLELDDRLHVLMNGPEDTPA